MFESDESDIVHMQRISRETVEYLRALKKDLTITTGTIERGVVEALRKSGVVDKVNEHDHFIKGLSKRMTMAFSQLIGVDEKIKQEKKK